VEERCPLWERRGLGFRKQALPRPKTVLGPGDPTQVHSPCGAESRNPEAIRMAHVPAYVLDSAAECWNRIQGDAGTASTFDLALNVGRLHTGDYSGEACSASSRHAAGLFFRCEWRIIHCRTGNCCHVAGEKRPQKGRETCPFRALDGLRKLRLNLGMNGGDDETRTRDLCRDRILGKSYCTLIASRFFLNAFLLHTP
jgi:hypothetical protein